MANHTGLSPKGPVDYTGPNVYLAVVVTRNRAPTGADYRQPETGKLYTFNTFWLVGKNPTTGVQGDLWYLSKIVANVAYWVKLSASAVGPLLSITVPLGVSPIVPTALGVVNFTSVGGTLAITGSLANPNNNNINFDLVGGSVGLDSVQVQASTAPGVNPVVPTGAGLITINGAAVAAHSIPIETRTRSLNTFNIELQYASASAVSDPTKSGIMHLNSADFTVDPNGFVSAIAGATAVTHVTIQTFTSNGTYTPTSGMLSAFIEIVGGGGGGGASGTTTGSQQLAGGGGGGGEYASGVFSAATIGASQAVTIGAAGAGGVGANGSAGGNSSVGALISANGGSGGIAMLSGGAVQYAAGGAGGTGGAGGSFRTKGQAGGGGVMAAGSVFYSGTGAPGQFSGGAASISSLSGSNAGNASSGRGGGGGGAITGLTSAGATGGAGTAGTVIITEYVA
jgi:hypothetical protein